MDDFMVQKLTAWGLAQYVDNFRAHGITQANVRFLTDDHVATLVPLLGDQLVFNFHAAQLKSQEAAEFPLLIIESEVAAIPSPPTPAPTAQASTSTAGASAVAESSDCSALRHIISKSAYGRSVLALRRRLRLKERRTVAEMIVNFSISGLNDKVIKSQFVTWAEALTVLFPLDIKDVWYAEATKTPTCAVAASGALLRAYYSLRRDHAIMHDDDYVENDDEDVVDLPDSVAADALWLSLHLEPWALVTEKWLTTRDYRKTLRKHTDYSVTTYLERFKVLRQPNGYELIAMDFLLDHNIEDVEERLNTFATAAFQELKKLSPRPKLLAPLIQQGDIALANGGKLNILKILMSLSYLVPTHTVLKKRAKSKSAAESKGWRPTVKEVQNGFITVIANVSELQGCIESRTNLMTIFRLTRQPFVILVDPSESLENISASYVCINDFYYLMPSPLEALDICFKSFFALNTEYSLESRPLWLLLQTAVFSIFTPDDRRVATPSAITVLARFNIALH